MTSAERALDVVRSKAHIHREAAAERWRQSTAGKLRPDLDAVVTDAKAAGRLAVNFHPDRSSQSGLTAAGGMATTGEYLSQWRTGTSSGGRFARSGGERQRWEHELFGDAYLKADPLEIAFPIYGTWDLRGDPQGGAPRFGSCYLVLDDRVRERATICLGDSHVGPSDYGTLDTAWSVIAGLAEQADSGHVLQAQAGAADLLGLLSSQHVSNTALRELDNYVEMQIHGGVDLASDVTSIVADPSFKGTSTERSLDEIAGRYGITISWHAGSELAVEDVPTDFRGAAMPSVARQAARPDGIVDAHSIGAAAQSVPWSAAPTEGDAPESNVQQLKRLWHTVVAYGHDARAN